MWSLIINHCHCICFIILQAKKGLICSLWNAYMLDQNGFKLSELRPKPVFKISVWSRIEQECLQVFMNLNWNWTFFFFSPVLPLDSWLLFIPGLLQQYLLSEPVFNQYSQASHPQMRQAGHGERMTPLSCLSGVRHHKEREAAQQCSNSAERIPFPTSQEWGRERGRTLHFPHYTGDSLPAAFLGSLSGHNRRPSSYVHCPPWPSGTVGHSVKAFFPRKGNHVDGLGSWANVVPLFLVPLPS